MQSDTVQSYGRSKVMQSDTVQSYGPTEVDTRPVGVDLRKKPKDLSTSDREDRGHGKGVGVYATLLQSNTVQSYGRGKADTSPVGFELRKKPKVLSSSEERGYGPFEFVFEVYFQQNKKRRRPRKRKMSR